jgi:hypothetical protein
VSEPENAPRAVAEAIELARLREVRDERGRFVTGAPGPRLKDGLRARTLLDVPALAEAHRGRFDAIGTCAHWQGQHSSRRDGVSRSARPSVAACANARPS